MYTYRKQSAELLFRFNLKANYFLNTVDISHWFESTTKAIVAISGTAPVVNKL